MTLPVLPRMLAQRRLGMATATGGAEQRRCIDGPDGRP
jgi:hypothetical protein